MRDRLADRTPLVLAGRFSGNSKQRLHRFAREHDKTVKTDVNGHYVSDALPAGAYRVTLILNGAIRASIDSAKTKSGQPTQLNFDLKSTSASQASGSIKKTKHKVWVPAGTGTHLGGSWVEVDDNATAPRSRANADRVDAVDGSALKKLQGTHGTLPGP